MLIDRPQIVEGSFITNASVPTGTTDPAAPNPGELFFRTDLNAFRFYNNSDWVAIPDAAALATHVADDARHLTAPQNTFLDGITVTFTDVNSILTIASNLSALTTNFNAHVGDDARHVTPAQNTFLDGLNLPSLTAAEVNFLDGVTSSVQLQFNSIKATADGAATNLAVHIADDTRHLSAAQNTFLDGVSVTATEANQLSGVTSNIQAQLNAVSGNKVSKTGDSMSGPLSMGANKITTTAVPTVPADVSNKKYVDDSDYLNFNPKAGLTSADSSVPIYSDFKFALGVWGSGSFTYVDRDSKQVIFYHAQSPTRMVRVFRAFRFSDNDTFVFDNDPVSLTFLTGDEYIRLMLNLGTYFAYVGLASAATGSITRWLLVKTGGSSRWQDWSLGYDVTSIQSGNNNFALLQDSSGDRIMQVVYTGPTSTLNVYGPTLTVLRSQTLYTSATEIDPVDHTGNARTGLNITFAYSPAGLAFPFTWDPSTQTLHQKNSGYYTYTQAGVNVGQGFALSISWSVPRSWITSGVATPSNLIPIKNSTYRYSGYSDSTWDTDDGGMSISYGGSGQATSLVTDEYSGNIFMTSHNTFTSAEAGNIYRLAYSAGKVYKTFGATIEPFIQNNFFVSMPDGSAWSKQIDPSYGLIINNNIQFVGFSTRYGSRLIGTTFSTTQFSSIARANDTLKLDAAAAILSPESTWPAAVQTAIRPGAFSTVVVGGSPIAMWSAPGQVIYTASVSGATRTFSPTAVSHPPIPATIDAIGDLSYAGNSTWNGSLGSPTIWALVRNATTMYVAKWVAGVWTLSSAVFQQQLNDGNTNRGDAAYLAAAGVSASVLTEQGRWIFAINVPYTGGEAHFTCEHNVNTNVMAVFNWDKFNSPTAGTGLKEYTGAGGYGGASFGYSSTFGYYAFRATSNYDSAYILSSKDVRGTGAAITEDQWFNNTGARYEVFVTTESATGLVAYLSEYPIFLGGYYTKIPTTSVTLLPSTVNYVYATKDPADRTTVNISVSAALLPSSFSRMRIAAITTNATQIVSMTTSNFDGIGLPDQSGNANKLLKTDGATLYWDDEYPNVRAYANGDIIAPSDNNGFTSVGTMTINVPASLPIGFKTTIFVNAGSEVLTLVPTGGALVYWMGSGNGVSGTRNISAAGWVTLHKMSSNTWMIFGEKIS